MEPRAGSFEVYLDWTGPDGANHTGLAPRTLLVCSRLPLVAFSLSPPIPPLPAWCAVFLARGLLSDCGGRRRGGMCSGGVLQAGVDAVPQPGPGGQPHPAAPLRRRRARAAVAAGRGRAVAAAQRREAGVASGSCERAAAWQLRMAESSSGFKAGARNWKYKNAHWFLSVDFLVLLELIYCFA